VSTDSSQGKYRGRETRSYLFTHWNLATDWLTDSTGMFVLFYISLPLVKEISHYRKNPVKTFPRTMNTCVQLVTAINKRIQTLYGKEASQHSTHIPWQVHALIACKPK